MSALTRHGEKKVEKVCVMRPSRWHRFQSWLYFKLFPGEIEHMEHLINDVIRLEKENKYLSDIVEILGNTSMANDEVDETVEALLALIAEDRAGLVELLREIKSSGDWYNSALEFNHDIYGEELLAKIDAAIGRK